MYLPGSNVKSLYCDPVEHVFTEVYPDFILKKSQFLFVVQMLFLFFFNFVQQLQTCHLCLNWESLFYVAYYCTYGKKEIMHIKNIVENRH